MDITVDWNSEQTHVLFNPKKYSLDEQARIAALLPRVDAHIWIESSGTMGSTKWLALSKRAFLASAFAVNQHLSATKEDRWLCALPVYHVGGLSIFARAYLSYSDVVLFSEKWSTEEFLNVIAKEKITLTSLVPTQIYDLVQASMMAPESLRAVVVGGAALSEELYSQARHLGWPLLPSFGMTECCSQIATASLTSLKSSEFPGLKILSHVQVRMNNEDCAEISSESLATAVAYIDDGQVRVEDPKQDGFWPTRDQVRLHDGMLKFIQRLDDVVKIAGEQVSLTKLNNLLMSFVEGEDQVLVATPSQRWGSQVDLVTTKEQFARLEPKLEEYNQKVMPFERIQNIYFIEDLPRTELGKIKTKEILKQIGY